MAGTVTHNKDAGQLMVGLPSTGLVGWRRLNPLLKQIAARLSLTVSVEGLDASEIARGIHLKLEGKDLEAEVRVRTYNHNLLATEESPQTISLSEGGSSFFTLSAYIKMGYGEIEYKWTKDGAPFSDEPVIGYNTFAEGDAGLYACTIRDTRGSEVTIQVTVEVND